MRFSLVYLLIICGFKRIFQIKEGFTLVYSAHFKPEDMYVTMAGAYKSENLKLCHRSLRGPRRVKSADKTN